MTEQEFRDSCAKFNLRVLLDGFQEMEDYLICQWQGITFGHYNKVSCLARITDALVKNKFYIMGKRYTLLNSDLEHTSSYFHKNDMENRFTYLIKSYKQGMINEKLREIDNDFE